MRVAGSICAGLYAGFEENRKPDQPLDPCQILDKGKRGQESRRGARIRSSRPLASKRRVTQVDGILGLRGHCFDGKYAYVVTARGKLAFHLDLLALVTHQRGRIRHRPGLAVFSDQAFSILADRSGDGGCLGRRGLTMTIALTENCSGQQSWNQKKRKNQFFHRGSSSIGPRPNQRHSQTALAPRQTRNSSVLHLEYCCAVNARVGVATFFLTLKHLGFPRTLTRSADGRARSPEETTLGGGRCILVDDFAFGNRLRGRACQQPGEQHRSGRCNIGPAGTETRRCQSARGSQMAVQRVRRCELSAGLQSSRQPPIPQSQYGIQSGRTGFEYGRCWREKARFGKLPLGNGAGGADRQRLGELRLLGNGAAGKRLGLAAPLCACGRLLLGASRQRVNAASQPVQQPHWIRLALCQGQFHLHSSLGRRLHSLPNVWGERELPLLQKKSR